MLQKRQFDEVLTKGMDRVVHPALHLEFENDPFKDLNRMYEFCARSAGWSSSAALRAVDSTRVDTYYSEVLAPCSPPYLFSLRR